MINIGDIIDDQDAFELFDKARYVAWDLSWSYFDLEKDHKSKNSGALIVESSYHKEGEKLTQEVIVKTTRNFSVENAKKVYRYVLKRNLDEKEIPEQGEVLKYVPGKWKKTLDGNYSMALDN